MKNGDAFAAAAASALLIMTGSAFAQVLPDYQLITTIPLASNAQSFDISWIDQGTQRYYLADRGNGSGQGRIDVIDTDQNAFLYSIPSSSAEIGFAGLKC